jgi:acetyl-CoA acetyltransferase
MMFGNAGREHREKYGTTQEQFAKIAVKNHEHSTRNPYAQFQKEFTLEEVLASPTVHEPLTKLQCCPTSDGGGAAILCSGDFVRKHGLEKQAIEIAGMTMTTDYTSTFDEKSCIKLVGADMTRQAAQKVYEQSGIGPEDVDVIELHDCFSCNELITYEGLGLCPEGKGGELIDSGAVTYGGQWVVNPSGGLISKGHPLGATGLAQCSELNWQLRGLADARQVDGAKIGLQHNLGLGGAAVVTIYRKPEQIS